MLCQFEDLDFGCGYFGMELLDGEMIGFERGEEKAIGQVRSCLMGEEHAKTFGF